MIYTEVFQKPLDVAYSWISRNEVNQNRPKSSRSVALWYYLIIKKNDSRRLRVKCLLNPSPAACALALCSNVEDLATYRVREAATTLARGWSQLREAVGSFSYGSVPL